MARCHTSLYRFSDQIKPEQTQNTETTTPQQVSKQQIQTQTHTTQRNMANTQPNVGSNSGHSGRPAVREGPGHRGFTLTESTVPEPSTATLCCTGPSDSPKLRFQRSTTGLMRGVQGATEGARDRAIDRRLGLELSSIDPSAFRLSVDFSRFSPLPKTDPSSSPPSSPDFLSLETPKDFEFDPNSLFLDEPIEAPQTQATPEVAAVTAPTVPRQPSTPIAPRNPPGPNNPRPSRFTEDLSSAGNVSKILTFGGLEGWTGWYPGEPSRMMDVITEHGFNAELAELFGPKSRCGSKSSKSKRKQQRAAGQQNAQ